MTAFPVTRVAHIEGVDTSPPWLIDTLWGDQAVGFIAGTPKTGLCRARHNPVHPASRVMPRDSVSLNVRAHRDPV